MKILRILTALAALATVSACATPFEVSRVQDVLDAPAPTAGTPFTQALATEYKDATRHEALDEWDWEHAAVFAEKAEKAAAGEAVLPEDPATSVWEAPAESLPELTAAHAALTRDFETGARERVPAAAAKAQVALDCWLEEEWERDADAECRTVFKATEPGLKPPPPPLAAPPPLPPQPLLLHFDFNKADITAAAMQTLYEAAPALKAAHLIVIHVSGYTDTVGGKAFNKVLSLRRAKAVADQLRTLGVEGVTLDLVGYGKENLAVPTRNNVREARNRRVEVTWDPAPPRR